MDQTRSGPINISEEELETIFEIERYSNAVEKLEEAISVYTKDNSTYIRLEIKDSNRAEDGDDNAWSIAFEALRLFAKDYLGLVDMPFMIYYYGRKYAGTKCYDSTEQHMERDSAANQRWRNGIICSACGISGSTVCVQGFSNSCHGRSGTAYQTPQPKDKKTYAAFEAFYARLNLKAQ